MSPLLANIYLHYVLDLWLHAWRKKQARGDVVAVRFADDFIVGFEHEEDGRRFLDELRERLRKFALELHPDKTCLIEFGRYARANRHKRGERGAPETFCSLGFVHICGLSKAGRFLLLRHTDKKRMLATLQALKPVLARRRHDPIPEQGRWLASVVRGYIAYYAVPTHRAVARFRSDVIRAWCRQLRQRSHRHRLDWRRMTRIADRWLPPARVQHPWPDDRFRAKTRGGSRVR